MNIPLHISLRLDMLNAAMKISVIFLTNTISHANLISINPKLCIDGLLVRSIISYNLIYELNVFNQ